MQLSMYECIIIIIYLLLVIIIYSCIIQLLCTLICTVICKGNCIISPCLHFQSKENGIIITIIVYDNRMKMVEVSYVLANCAHIHELIVTASYLCMQQLFVMLNCVTVAPQSSIPRTMKHSQIQHSIPYGERVVYYQQPPTGRDAHSAQRKY